MQNSRFWKVCPLSSRCFYQCFLNKMFPNIAEEGGGAISPSHLNLPLLWIVGQLNHLKLNFVQSSSKTYNCWGIICFRTGLPGIVLQCETYAWKLLKSWNKIPEVLKSLVFHQSFWWLRSKETFAFPLFVVSKYTCIKYHMLFAYLLWIHLPLRIWSTERWPWERTTRSIDTTKRPWNQHWR